MVFDWKNRKRCEVCTRPLRYCGCLTEGVAYDPHDMTDWLEELEAIDYGPRKPNDELLEAAKRAREEERRAYHPLPPTNTEKEKERLQRQRLGLYSPKD